MSSGFLSRACLKSSGFSRRVIRRASAPRRWRGPRGTSPWRRATRRRSGWWRNCGRAVDPHARARRRGEPRGAPPGQGLEYTRRQSFFMLTIVQSRRGQDLQAGEAVEYRREPPGTTADARMSGRLFWLARRTAPIHRIRIWAARREILRSQPSRRKRPERRSDRVGGGLTPSVLPHHRTYGSVYGGSWFMLNQQNLIQE
jgi:hypothetical protein